MTGPWTTHSGETLMGGTITLVEGSSFCLSSSSGDVLPGLPHGLIFRDTRFVSDLRLRVNGRWPESLGALTLDPFSASFVLRDPPQPGLADSHLLITRHRYVGRGMREDIDIRNFSETPRLCGIELNVDADFADVFEVKEGRISTAGELDYSWTERQLNIYYQRGRFRRATQIDFSQRPTFDDRVVCWETFIPPRGSWQLCLEVTPVFDGQPVVSRYRCGQPIDRGTPGEQLAAWRRTTPRLETEHEPLQTVLRRSIDDLAALRLIDPNHPERTVIAAGAPWFMTLFGRDSIITSWMAMPIDRDLALGTLHTLAELQGRDVDPVTEEQPGRILHEVRFSENAQLALGGSNVYYGSVDATPLFVMLLGELARWGAPREMIDPLIPAADRAIAWIDQYGDLDGDGYVEYLAMSKHGLRNQGWKDSWDSTRFADGRLAEPPVALCEVQAYVYAALRARARLAAEEGDSANAAMFHRRAEDLKRRFNEDFWVAERGWLAMGLDAEKRQIDALVSNAGHCLWTGILDDDHAAVVAANLLSDEMFSGWGIRTLATSMAGYNPISYHNGSVWPHDTAIAVAGLMRYGFVDEALRVVEGLLAAGGFFAGRLPELFAGLSRDEQPFPVAYPTSCSPQAWAAAAPLLLLRAILRLEPDAGEGVLHIAPALPGWLRNLRIDGIRVRDGLVSVEVSDHDRVTVTATPPDFVVVHTPRPGGTPD